MVDTSVATAVPSRIELNGVEYVLPPLTDRDYGEFERWLKDREIQLAADLAKNAESEEQRKAMFDRAYDRASEIHINHPSALKAMVSFEGATKLLHINLRHNHPDMTHEQVKELCHDPLAMEAAYAAVEQLNFPGKVEGAETEGTPGSGSTSGTSTGSSPVTTDGSRGR